MSPVKVSILLGLSFFFGLAFEGFYAKSQSSRPGGIRTFPLISLSGALLYELEPHYAIAFCVGLVVLGIWLYPYYQVGGIARQRSGEFHPTESWCRCATWLRTFSGPSR